MGISETTQMTNQLIKNEIEDLHTLLIAKIIEIDNSKRMAKIVFLQKTIKSTLKGTMQTIPEINDFIPIVPIFDSLYFSIWASYKVGDKVLVQVSERPLYEPLVSNEISEQQQHGRMQINYSFILKPIPHDLLTGIQKESDSLYIEHKESGNYFKFAADGNIEISANVKINGDLEVSGNSIASDHLSSEISGKDHTHGNVQSGNSKTGKPE